MQRQTFRQWGMWMVGGCVGLIGMAILVGAAVGLSTASAAVTAWTAVAVAVAYVVFLRPCVVLDDAGITVRNIVKDITIPWSVVEGTRVRWELAVETAHGTFSAWAIAGAPGPSRDWRRGARQPVPSVAGGQHAPGWDTPPAGAAHASAEPARVENAVANEVGTDAKATTISGVIHARVERYLREVEAGSRAEQPDLVQQRLVPVAVLLLSVPTLVAVLVTIA